MPALLSTLLSSKTFRRRRISEVVHALPSTLPSNKAFRRISVVMASASGSSRPGLLKSVECSQNRKQDGTLFPDPGLVRLLAFLDKGQNLGGSRAHCTLKIPQWLEMEKSRPNRQVPRQNTKLFLKKNIYSVCDSDTHSILVSATEFMQ